MFRQALLRDQVRLYAAQSGLISVLAVIVAAARHLPDLYVLAGLSVALKVVVIPLVLRRLLRGTGPGAQGRGAGHRGQRLARPGQHRAARHRRRRVRVVRIGALGIRSPVPPATALSISVAVVLVAFVLMINRRDVASQAIGLFSLENGIRWPRWWWRPACRSSWRSPSCSTCCSRWWCSAC